MTDQERPVDYRGRAIPTKAELLARWKRRLEDDLAELEEATWD